MAIYQDINIVVNQGLATADKTLYVFKGNRNILLNFKVITPQYMLTKSSNDILTNRYEAECFEIAIANANGEGTYLGGTIENGICTVLLTEYLIQELAVGSYTYQITLMDEDNNAIISYPLCKNAFNILEVLEVDPVITPSETGTAQVNVTSVAVGQSAEEILDSEGEYNRHIWVNGELITDSLLNKLELIAYLNRQKINELEANSQTKVDENLNTTDKTIVGAINEVFQRGSDVKAELVDALFAKGIQCSTSDTFEYLISQINNVGTGLNIIAAPELPEKAPEYQICVLTDSGINNFKVSSILNHSTTEQTQDEILIQLGDGIANYTVVNNNMATSYRILWMLLNSEKLESYYRVNNEWKLLTVKGVLDIMLDKFYGANDSSNAWIYTSKGLETPLFQALREYVATTNEKINFDLYSRVDVSAYFTTTTSASGVPLNIVQSDEALNGLYAQGAAPVVRYGTAQNLDPNEKVYTYDLSLFTGEHYFGLSHYKSNINVACIVTDIKFHVDKVITYHNYIIPESYALFDVYTDRMVFNRPEDLWDAFDSVLTSYLDIGVTQASGAVENNIGYVGLMPHPEHHEYTRARIRLTNYKQAISEYSHCRVVYSLRGDESSFNRYYPFIGIGDFAYVGTGSATQIDTTDFGSIKVVDIALPDMSHPTDYYLYFMIPADVNKAVTMYYDIHYVAFYNA